jgi:hypothetical protein
MQDFVIQKSDSEKSRQFQATLVSAVAANALFEEGANGSTIRPVWAMFAGTDTELRPFTMNLRLGRKAEPLKAHYSKTGDSERIEFLKSVGFQVVWQREAEGTLVTLYHPDLFRLDPGMVDPLGASFILLVPSYWAATQKLDLDSLVGYAMELGHPLEEDFLMALAPTAYLFAAYLDRRTRCPLVADGRFYMQILLSALSQGLASFPGEGFRWGWEREGWGFHSRFGFKAQGLDNIGLEQAICFSCSHETLEKFLAGEVEAFFEKVDQVKGREDTLTLNLFGEDS